MYCSNEHELSEFHKPCAASCLPWMIFSQYLQQCVHVEVILSRKEVLVCESPEFMLSVSTELFPTEQFLILYLDYL